MFENAADLRRAVVTRLTECSLTQDCLSDGPFNAHIAVVGEFPGEREQTTKMPFSGGAGKALWDALRPHGITRQHVYTTYVVKRRVHFTKHNKVPVPRNEFDHWSSILRWELCQLPNLKYIFVVGEFALNALMNENSVMNWRGSVVPISLRNMHEGVVRTRNVTAVCSINPSMLLKEPRLEVMFKLDVAKLIRVREGKYIPHKITEYINPSPQEAHQWLDKMHDDKLPIAFDIETMAGETACIGFANDPHVGMCINFRDMETNRFSLAEERDLRLRIQKLFKDPTTKFVAQNAMFDSYWLWYKDRIKVGPVWFDTMLAHHTLYPTLPHSLGFLTSQYTEHPFYKDEGKDWREGGDVDQFWRYNVKDCCITRAVQQALHGELQQQKMDKFFFEHVMRLQPHLVRMTVGGMLIDVDKKEALAEELREKVARLEQEFIDAARRATGEDDLIVSPRSPKQLQTLYFTKLKLVGRTASTAADNRDAMRKHPRTSKAAIAVLDAHDAYAVDQKFLSTYANMVIDPDKRARSEYRQTGTQSAPGRLSSAQVMWGSGMNLQNQPERSHVMFLFDKGYGGGYFDLAQAEARVVAWEAGIDSWKEQFERARLNPGTYDAHIALASEMWNIPYDEVPKEDRDENGNITLRFKAKRCRHGLNYRMGADRLAQTTGMSLQEAEEAYHIYHRTTPELRRWWDSLVDEVKRNRMLFNAYGRRLLFLERLSDEALESVVAFKPQSLVGDHVCRVIYQAESDDRWPIFARMILNIHDALICIAPLSKIKTCLSIMKKYAEQPIYIKGEPMIIPADCKETVADETGWHRWSTLKKTYVEAAK